MSPFSKTVRAADCLHCQHRSTHMFCNLAPMAFADYDSIGANVQLPAEAVLFREGDPGNRVIVLCDGHVKLSCSSRDGRAMNLKIAAPGDVLGLSAVLSGSAFEVTAEALDPVTVKSINRTDFLEFLAREGEASLHAAKSLADEYKSAFSDARRLALSGSVTARLASLLLDWASAASCGKPEMRFTMALTHDELANFTATTRESISRALGKFQKDNLIAIHGSSIHILAPDRLANLTA